MTPDSSAIPAARSQIKQAEEKLQTALKVLRKAGWTESADELLPILKRAQCWTQKDGWLDWLERE